MFGPSADQAAPGLFLVEAEENLSCTCEGEMALGPLDDPEKLSCSPSPSVPKCAAAEEGGLW